MRYRTNRFEPRKMAHVRIEQLRDDEVIFVHRFDSRPFSFDHLQRFAQSTLRRRRPWADSVRITTADGREITWSAADEFGFTPTRQPSIEKSDLKDGNPYHQHSEYCARMAEKSVGDKETWMWFSQQWLKLAEHPRDKRQTARASTTLADLSPSTEGVPSQCDGVLGRPQRRRRGARNGSGKAKTPACDALRVAPKKIEGDRGNGPGRCERGDRGHDRDRTAFR
jgi:hypothetical protein